MAASFPTSIKSFTTKTDNLDYPLAEHINSPQDEIVALETLLGVNGGSWISEGQMLNGKLSVSVATNDLTVSLVTIAGTNASASNPIYVRINNTVRKITGALSVTKLDGTNWCNSGGAEVAAKEIDYFVYLGYNATDGVVIGFSRIPYGTQYSSFSATSTNDKYCAISTITNAAAGDYYVNIGRFAATLSAGAAYTWTVPTFTNANLINQPIFQTRPLTWLPSYTNLTIGNGTGVYYYQIVGSRCQVQGSFILGTTSSVGGLITAVLPIQRTSAYYAGGTATPFIGACKIFDTGAAIFDCTPQSAATNTVSFYAKISSTAYVNLTGTTATVPMTWTTADAIEYWLDYLLAEQ